MPSLAFDFVGRKDTVSPLLGKIGDEVGKTEQKFSGFGEKAGKGLGGLGEQVDKTEKKFSGFGAKVGAGMAAAGVGAGAVLSKGLSDNLDIASGTAKLAGQMRLTTGTASAAGKAAGEVYRDNFGGSVSEVNDAIKAVGSNMVDLNRTSQPQMKQLAEGALAIASTFDVDVNDATRAAGVLMKTGLAANATQAFDVITTGFQGGLDASGDFLDTLNEYGSQFAKLGIDGPEAIGLLQAGLKAGARDTDSVADAFKELSIRAIDGSKLTAEGFKAIGLDADKTSAAFARGGKSAEDATTKTISGLLKIKDPQKQNAAGVALFGTQWEDTARKILPALDMTKLKTQSVDGATQKMAATVGDTGAAKIETMKRKMEGWTQSMASSQGPLGTVSAGVVAFGGGALAAGSQVALMASALRGTAVAAKVMAVAQGALNLVMTANPIGIAVVALAALAAGLVYAYKHSETFRTGVQTALRLTGEGFSQFAKVALIGIKFVVGAYLSFVGTMISGAAKAFGWMPGIGPKLKTAAAQFDKFKGDVNRNFDSAIEKVGSWNASLRKSEKVLKLQGNIKDLDKKIADAKVHINSVPLSKRSAFLATIRDLQLKRAQATAELNKVKDRTVKINATFKPVNSPLKVYSPSAKGAVFSVVMQPHRAGGWVRGPGGPTADKVPILASAKEYVLRAAAAAKLSKVFGPGFLDMINNYDRAQPGGDAGSFRRSGTPRFAQGGSVQAVKSWLPSVAPLPYFWGGVGPSSYDCSGLVGEVYARLTGRKSYRRYFTTANLASAPGISPGPGTFSIGVTPGVHTAGNLAGLGFEASSPRSGIHVGRGAKSVGSFPRQYHLDNVQAFSAAQIAAATRWAAGHMKYNLAARKSGGPVRAGHAYEVGESGRETFVPGGDGYIYPRSLRRGGGGAVVQFSGDIHVHGVQNPAEMVRALQDYADKNSGIKLKIRT